jgi:beta-mannosidase
MWRQGVLFLCLGLVSGHGLSLDGQDWKLSNSNRSLLELPVRVPGVVHQQLFHAGVIQDPLFGFNEQNYRWIAHDNWTFEKQFEIECSSASSKDMELRFEGLDTISRVSLNGILLGHTNNMFRSWRFNVSNVLQCRNTLVIEFQSAVGYANQRAQFYPYPVPVSGTFLGNGFLIIF